MALDRDETSERVLEIAESLVSEGGAAGLKARSIAERAGIAVGSIYNLFGPLDRLHGVVNLRIMDRLAEAGNSAVRHLDEQGVIDTRQKLLGLARAYLEFVLARPVAWAALLAFNPRSLGVEEQGQYVRRLDALFEIIAGVLADDPTLDVSPEKRRQMARVLWLSVHGIVVQSIVMQESEDKARRVQSVWDHIDLLVTTFLRGVDHRPAELH